MNFTILPTNMPKFHQDQDCTHLLNKKIPKMSLPNQDENFLKLNREDTFRLVIFCYPMTGNPNLPLPKNWDKIPGASGCTAEVCSFRDNYDELIIQNAIPIGISTQSSKEIKEMTSRLVIPYDVLSDSQYLFSETLNLPFFSTDKKKFIKRLTLIVEKSVIKNIFYPIIHPEKHIYQVLDWLKKN